MPSAQSAQIVAEVLTSSSVVTDAEAAQLVAEVLTSQNGFPGAKAGQNVAEVLTTAKGIPNLSPYSIKNRTAKFQGVIQVPLAAVPWASPYATISPFKNTCQFAAFDDGGGLGFDADNNCVAGNMAVATPVDPFLFEINTGVAVVKSGPWTHFNNYIVGTTPQSPSTVPGNSSLGIVKELAPIAASATVTKIRAQVHYSPTLGFQTPLVTTALFPMALKTSSEIVNWPVNFVGTYLGYLKATTPGPYPFSTANCAMDAVAMDLISSLGVHSSFGQHLITDTNLFTVPGTTSDFMLAGNEQWQSCIDWKEYDKWLNTFIDDGKPTTFLFNPGNAFAARVIIPLNGNFNETPAPYPGEPSNLENVWNPIFDDAAIQAVWNALPANSSVLGTYAGWLILLADNAMFGSRHTYILVSADWSKWWFIQIQTQDGPAGKALEQTADKLSICIDPAGIFWLSTSNPHFFSSYSYFLAVPRNVPGAIGLPCYVPCELAPIGISTI